jgi:2-oxoglutarate ferredoxin oxidoreductase subunit delta
MGKRETTLKKRQNSPVVDLNGVSKSAPDQKKSKRKEREFRIEIYKAWCKACGICVTFCPAHVFTKEEQGYPQVAHPEACIGCGWCEIHCPDFAITVREKKPEEKLE